MAEEDPALRITNLDTGEVMPVQSYVAPPLVEPSSCSVTDTPRPELRMFLKFKNRPFYDKATVIQSFKAHTKAVRCIARSKDGDLVATGGESGEVCVFELKGTMKLVRRYQGHTSDVTSLAFSAEGLLLSASIDKTVKLWHVSREEALGTFCHAESVAAVVWHPKEASVLCAGTFTNAVVWDVGKNEIVHTVDFTSPAMAVAFSPDGAILAIGQHNGVCSFYAYTYQDMMYKTKIVAGQRKKKKVVNKQVTSIVFNSPGSFLVATNDSRIRMYSTDNFMLIRKFIGHESKHGFVELSMSPDQGMVMISSEKKGAVMIWPIEHEKHFKAKLGKFSRERSQTCEGFKFPEKTRLNAAMFTAVHTATVLSVVVGDDTGNVYLVASE